MRKALQWAVWAVLVDALAFVGILALMDSVSTPAFGPPSSFAPLASAFEELHWPLSAVVTRLQEHAGAMGSFLQSWRTPEAQALRMAVFALQAFVMTFAAAWAAFGWGGSAGTGATSHEGRLKEFAGGGQGWRTWGSFKDMGEVRAFEKDLDRALDALKRDPRQWQELLETRARLLIWTRSAGSDHRLWLALGEATLALAVRGGLEPREEALRFGRACLVEAWRAAPQESAVAAAVLAWDALAPDEAAEAAAALERSAPAHPEPLRWRVRRCLAEASEAPVIEDEMASKLKRSHEGELLYAEALFRAGRLKEVLDLLAFAVRWDPMDLRSRTLIKATAAQLGEAAIKRVAALPAFHPPVAGPDWVLALAPSRSWSGGLGWIGRALAMLLVTAYAVLAFNVVLQARPSATVWQGRWVCDAIISPAGARIPTGRYPEVYPSPLAEEACGYTQITQLGPTMACILEKDGRGEIRVGKELFQLTWIESWGCAYLHLEGSDLEPVLRNGPDGAEMALVGHTWHLLMKHESDRQMPVKRDLPGDGSEGVQLEDGQTWVVRIKPTTPGTQPLRIALYKPFVQIWKGPAAKLHPTSKGTFLDLGERGFAKVAEADREPDVYEGVNSDLQPPVAEEEIRASSSWRSQFTVEAAYRAPEQLARECRRCSRRSSCSSAVEVWNWSAPHPY